MDTVWGVNAIVEMDIMVMTVDSVMDSFKMIHVLMNVLKVFMLVNSSVHLVIIVVLLAINLIVALPVYKD